MKENAERERGRVRSEQGGGRVGVRCVSAGNGAVARKTEGSVFFVFLAGNGSER